LLQLTQDTSILDIGCGVGTLLYFLRELGFKNLLGIDPFNKKDVEYPNGVKILKKEISEVDGQWDLIMLHHSFEHLPDPKKTLETVFALLNAGGDCVIRTPIVPCYAWEYYKEKWVQLDPPRHFYVHSIESIEILGNQSGLSLYKVIYDSTSFQFWGSEQYKREIPSMDLRSFWINPKGSIFSKNEIAAYDKQATLLNEQGRGDQAIFYLRKMDSVRGNG